MAWKNIMVNINVNPCLNANSIARVEDALLNSKKNTVICKKKTCKELNITL